MVVCHGDVDSVKVVKTALDEFNGISGLYPNISKSTIFFGSVNNETQNEIQELLNFIVGKLPMRYLGVPLVSKKIGVKECKSLINKITSWVTDWKNKCLTYAGRLQLISSVLASIQVYWMSVFKLPLSVIKAIAKVFKIFLWSQDSNSKGKTRVAWKEVCKPKNEGGLELKSLEHWNEVFMIKHIWCLLSNQDTIWV